MFFTRHLPKMLFVMGLATASVFIFAIASQWAIVNILQLPYGETFTTNYFDQGHHLIYQYWGVMVGFMGVTMVVAAFKPSWRPPVVFYSFAEKFLMVVLFGSVRGFANPNTHGFFGNVLDLWKRLYGEPKFVAVHK